MEPGWNNETANFLVFVPLKKPTYGAKSVSKSARRHAAWANSRLFHIRYGLGQQSRYVGSRSERDTGSPDDLNAGADSVDGS
jgi:hypothetical protein